MFYTGDLTSAISHAIQTHKLVACFITDPSDSLAQEWESSYLTHTLSVCDGDVCYRPQALGEAIGEKAVLLRMEVGSKETGFLSAFCPVDEAPMLVVIQNGQVLERIGAEVGREEFVGRILRAVGLKEQATGDEAEVVEGDATAQPEQSQATPSESQAPAAISSVIPSEDTPTQPPHHPHPQVRTLLEERAQRLEADKLQRDAAEQASRTARANARRRESEQASNQDKGKGKQRATDENTEQSRARQNWIYQQKQRKDEAKRERERIMAQIESDRQERKVRALLAREGMETTSPLQQQTETESLLRTSGAAATASSLSPQSGTHCSLQIRLFDGSSIRSRFPSASATLAHDVRDWIKQSSPPGSGGADIPYNFRQILAPQPSRSIEVSEEHLTLSDLDLCPSATLVLVPVAGAADAYAGLNAGYLGWLYGLAGRVSYFLPSFSRIYLGGTGDAQEESNVEGARMAGADSDSAGGGASVRVRSLADQRAEEAKRKRTEFYNGNSLGFEGRKEEAEEEGK